MIFERVDIDDKSVAIHATGFAYKYFYYDDATYLDDKDYLSYPWYKVIAPTALEKWND